MEKTETKARSSQEWREEFIQEWIALSEGRAAGANFDELVSKLYARYADADPRIVARREWNGPVFTVPDPVEFFSRSAIRHGLIAQGEKLDRRLMALAYDLFTVSYKSETKSTGFPPDAQGEAHPHMTTGGTQPQMAVGRKSRDGIDASTAPKSLV